MTKNLEKLPDVFEGKGEKKGCIFKKLEDKKDYCIYEVLDNNAVTYYEGFLKEVTPVCLDFKNRVYSETDFKEVYPKSNKFGSTAWTSYSLKNLKKIIFSTIVKKEMNQKRTVIKK